MQLAWASEALSSSQTQRTRNESLFVLLRLRSEITAPGFQIEAVFVDHHNCSSRWIRGNPPSAVTPPPSSSSFCPARRSSSPNLYSYSGPYPKRAKEWKKKGCPPPVTCLGFSGAAFPPPSPMRTSRERQRGRGCVSRCMFLPGHGETCYVFEQ